MTETMNASIPNPEQLAPVPEKPLNIEATGAVEQSPLAALEHAHEDNARAEIDTLLARFKSSATTAANTTDEVTVQADTVALRAAIERDEQLLASMLKLVEVRGVEHTVAVLRRLTEKSALPDWYTLDVLHKELSTLHVELESKGLLR